MKKTFLVSFAVFATSLDVYAQSFSSNTITIIATKNKESAFDLPLMTNKIQMDDTQNATANSMADIFRGTEGVEVTGSPIRNGQQISMRGYNKQNIIFLLDGARQNFASTHSANVFTDPSLLKQVEIAKGSSSAVYGSGGLGGVIAFETKSAIDMLAPNKKFGFSQKVGYFSANHERSNVSSVYGAGNKIDAIASFTARDSGTIQFSNGVDFNKSDQQIASGLIKTNYYIDNAQKVTFNVQTFNNKAEEFSNPQATPQETSGNNLVDKTTKSTTLKLGYEYNPSGKLVNFTTQAYRVNTEIGYKNLEATRTLPLGGKRVQELATTGFDAQNVSVFENGNAKHRLTYGLNYFENSQDSQNQAQIWNIVPKGKDSVVGVFIQDEITAGNFSIIPAIRYDEFRSEDGTNNLAKTKDDAISPRLAVGYKPTKWLNVFSSVASAFRAPSVSEKYTAGQHFAIPAGRNMYINTFSPNSNLKAEKNLTFEGGFALNFDGILAKKDNFSFKASYYQTQAKDYINQVVEQGGMKTCWQSGIGCDGDKTYFTNVGEATIKGVDLNASYQISKFVANVGYSYVNGKDDITGNYLGNLLPRTVKTNFSYQATESSIVGFRSQIARRFDTVNVNATANIQSQVAGYAVHDIYAKYSPKDNFDLTFSINNLFDTQYQKPNTGLFEFGRDFRVTASYKY